MDAVASHAIIIVGNKQYVSFVFLLSAIVHAIVVVVVPNYGIIICAISEMMMLMIHFVRVCGDATRHTAV